MEKGQKLIVVFPARLGDALFCTPALALLHEHLPAAIIDVIAMSAVTADMLSYNPCVKQTFVEPDETDLQKLYQQYDVAINLHFGAISNEILARLAPRHFSIDEPDYTQHQSQQALLFVQRYLQCSITQFDQGYRLYPQAAHHQKIKERLKQQGVNFGQDILIGCHIGCHRIAGLSWWKRIRGMRHKKVWPLKKFIRLAAELRAVNPDIKWVLTGSKSEQSLSKKFLKKQPQAINLIDQTSVLELAALMDYLAVFITSDTGALHVACAADVKLIALFGPTSIVRTGPYPPNEKRLVIQEPEIHRLAVSRVVNAVLSLGKFY